MDALPIINGASLDELDAAAEEGTVMIHTIRVRQSLKWWEATEDEREDLTLDLLAVVIVALRAGDDIEAAGKALVVKKGWGA